MSTIKFVNPIFQGNLSTLNMPINAENKNEFVK